MSRTITSVIAVVLCAGASVVPLSSGAAASAPPVVAITIGSPSATGLTSLKFTATDPDTATANLTLTCYVDGEFVPCRPGVALPYAAAAGTHRFSVRAVDPQGGFDASGKGWTVARQGKKPHAYIKVATLPEWGRVTDGSSTRAVTFGVADRAELLRTSCTLNGKRVPCRPTVNNGTAYKFAGVLPAGDATLIFRAVDVNAHFLTARRHFWTTFPRLAVTTSPVSSQGGVPVATTVASSPSATVQCRLLDGATVLSFWLPCPSSFKVTLPTGASMAKYKLKVKATTAGGTNTVARALYIDRVAPRAVSGLRGRLLQFSGDVPLSWKITNDEPLPVRYQVQTRHSRPASTLGRWRDRAVTRAHHQTLSLGRGESVCVRVRATDRAGNRSKWSGTGCRSRALDDRDFRAIGDWHRVRIDGFYAGTGIWASTPGAKLRLRHAAVRTIVVWGRKGPSGGELAVIVNGKHIDTVSLHSRKPGRAIVYSHTFPTTRHGDVELRVVKKTPTKTWRSVSLDAVVLSPFPVLH
ncbi:MAG: hypothetical protein WAN48_10635 [Actinomycetes bacterium]